jgi:hypothetical protein
VNHPVYRNQACRRSYIADLPLRIVDGYPKNILSYLAVVMGLEYYLFLATQWLGPVAMLSLAVLAVVAALKRPSASIFFLCFSIFAILAGLGANHLAIGMFGSREISPDGSVFTRFDPNLRLIGLLFQVLGFTTCLLGAVSMIWSLMSGTSPRS